MQYYKLGCLNSIKIKKGCDRLEQTIFNFQPPTFSRTRKEAREALKVEEIVNLPPELQDFWSNIPPDVELSEEMFKDITAFLIQNRGKKKTFALSKVTLEQQFTL